jgi:hypothetical protein
MATVLRGYAKAKDGNLVLIGTMPVPHPQENVRKEDILSDEALRCLRRRSLAGLLAVIWRQPFCIQFN